MRKFAWNDIAELVGLAAVIVSLGLLILEVRENSLAIQQQSTLARAEAITAPFYETDLAEILVKVAAVDGDFGMPGRFAERYELSLRQSILWERHLWHVWEVMQASYSTQGSSEHLDKQIRLLMLSPGNTLYLANARKYQFTDDFRRHVEQLERTQVQFLKSLDETRPMPAIISE